jgi:hypothetical protein
VNVVHEFIERLAAGLLSGADTFFHGAVLGRKQRSRFRSSSRSRAMATTIRPHMSAAVNGAAPPATKMGMTIPTSADMASITMKESGAGDCRMPF